MTSFDGLVIVVAGGGGGILVVPSPATRCPPQWTASDMDDDITQDFLLLMDSGSRSELKTTLKHTSIYKNVQVALPQTSIQTVKNKSFIIGLKKLYLELSYKYNSIHRVIANQKKQR